MKKVSDILVRDPFIYIENDKYYMFGTTDSDPYNGLDNNFTVYESIDLVNFDNGIVAFSPKENYWGFRNFWAPEVHKYKGKYYMFCSHLIKGTNQLATGILVSDNVQGKYEPLTNKPITPADWSCIDGTLYVDKEGTPYIIFVHEWQQISNGSICVAQLSDNLTEIVGETKTLFHASDAPWVHPYEEGKYVTDGPFIYYDSQGNLSMLWSSFVENKQYAIGVAKSSNGKINGDWVHNEKPVFDNDGGHGMIFRDLNNKLYLSIHKPNFAPMERLSLIELDNKFNM